ncbi:MAG: glycerate kinase [Phycisphaeraceae bacterium]
MKVLCAPDSFKGSLSAEQAADAMARGVLRAKPDAEVDLCPVSDGGEGFSRVITHAHPHKTITTPTLDPLGRPIRAQWFMLRQSGQQTFAVIEMAAASGLTLLEPAERDPTRTSTFGTGLLVRAALDADCQRIILGIGGSATCDGGCGMAQALGVRFYDGFGREIDQPITGGLLLRLAHIDMTGLDERLHAVSFTVACDVANPLTGPEGAAYVFAPQKGAGLDQVEQLDAGLKHLASLWRTQLGKGIEFHPGAGAAGGLGGGLLAFCDAELQSGVQIVLDTVRFDQRVRGCDLCLTGEGSLDGQSLQGKAVIGVAQAARKHGVPTMALVGRLGPGYEHALDAGLKDAIEIAPGTSVDESMARAAEFLEQAAERVILSVG